MKRVRGPPAPGLWIYSYTFQLPGANPYVCQSHATTMPASPGFTALASVALALAGAAHAHLVGAGELAHGLAQERGFLLQELDAAVGLDAFVDVAQDQRVEARPLGVEGRSICHDLGL